MSRRIVALHEGQTVLELADDCDMYTVTRSYAAQLSTLVISGQTSATGVQIGFSEAPEQPRIRTLVLMPRARLSAIIQNQWSDYDSTRRFSLLATAEELVICGNEQATAELAKYCDDSIPLTDTIARYGGRGSLRNLRIVLKGVRSCDTVLFVLQRHCYSVQVEEWQTGQDDVVQRLHRLEGIVEQQAKRISALEQQLFVVTQPQ